MTSRILDETWTRSIRSRRNLWNDAPTAVFGLNNFNLQPPWNFICICQSALNRVTPQAGPPVPPANQMDRFESTKNLVAISSTLPNRRRLIMSNEITRFGNLGPKKSVNERVALTSGK